MGLGSSFGISSETNNNIQTDGLVFYVDAAYKSSYPKSGTTWTDLAGSNNGTLTNGPTFDSDNGGSIVFDGGNDYVTLGNDTSLELQNLSILAWFNLDTLEADIDFYSSAADNGTNGYRLGTTGSTEIIWLVGDASGYTLKFSSGLSASTGEWKCVTATYDSSNLRIYIDGLLNVTESATKTITHANPIAIGGRGGDLGNHGFDGKIAIVQVYDRALTAAEILQNYNAQKERFGE